ncbi:pyridoxamine 5'-phosphate oxidase family protein [Stakelama saccharophila]|uniref:Pyridoxamine 5'-phosphate oxidase family protein n=1 Tax=Stakelama saccharophila TaxID=3075605 RepID=A0ABZ0B7T8_9SPHN|nr:pyridoxamine 5'-phosphate oxidase family protein [Stakelama sp. W311]WNO53307.1 pyridoxamine 5'-phosphate oxidase family protein [Stakelama sp. W311]
MTEAADIRKEMWKKLADSPFVMVGIEGDGEHSEPMTAQLDKDANSAFWFYTTKSNRIAKGGKAMAQFAAKGHDLFACIRGTLVEETDPAVIDRYWSKAVEAWYEGGRQDPKLKMMRFELGDAEIWEADTSAKGMFKLLTGRTVRTGEMGEHTDVAL